MATPLTRLDRWFSRPWFPRAEPSARRWAYVGIAAYCLFHLALRLALSPDIAVDDAEQLVLSQDLRLVHHPDKPPLYQWLVWLAAGIGGPGLAAIATLKYAVIAATLALLYEAARRLIGNARDAGLALIGLALFYLLGYALHVGYAHTVGLMAAVAATLYLTTLLAERRTLGRYLLLGLVLATGLLAKWSYAPFALALFAAVALTPAWRATVADRRFVLALLIGIGLYAPQLAASLDAADGLARVAERGVAPGIEGGLALSVRLQALRQVVVSYLEFLFPFVLIAPLLFPRLLTPAVWREAWRAPPVRMLALFTAIGFALVLSVSVAGGFTALKQRHLHPFLLFAPILVFAVLRHGGAAPGAERARAFVALGGLLAVVSAVALAVAALLPAPYCAKCRLQRPYPALAQHLANARLTQGTLIAGDEFIAANLRAALPGLRAYAVLYEFYRPPMPREPGPGRVCLVVSDETFGRHLRPRLDALVRQVVEGEPRVLSEETLSLPYRTGGGAQAFTLRRLAPAGDCR